MDWQTLMTNERIVAALVTALVGGGVVAMGWVITHWLSRRRDRALREEQIADIQRALLAEIRAHVVVLELADDIAITQDQITEADYLPILPHDANDRMFRALVDMGQVHLLPEWAIDAVVRYYRLIAVRTALAQDIRSVVKDHPRRAALMFRDYLEINDEARDTGLDAVEILTASLRGGPRLRASEREVKSMLRNRGRADAAPRLVAMQDQSQSGSGVNTRSADPSDL